MLKQAMKLWEIIFFPSDDAGHEYENISFLVRAPDQVEASCFVERGWQDKPSYIIPYAVCAIEFGVDPFSTNTKILAGPVKGGILEFYYKEEDDYVYWRRDDKDEQWTNVNELHKGSIVTYPAYSS